MKKLAVAILVLVTIGCASTASDDGPVPPVTPAPAADPRIAEMQTAMTELLDRIDVLNHRIAKLEEERAAGAADFSPPTSPTGGLTKPAAPQEAAPQPPQKALVGAKIADDYRQAIVLFGQGRYADARRAFEEVFEADTAGDLADNALFWIGETYFAAGDFSNAMRFYARVVNDYSDQNKAPDALFKTAMAQARTGDLALARKTLQQVIDRYPFSSPASAAKAELQRIRY